MNALISRNWPIAAAVFALVLTAQPPAPASASSASDSLFTATLASPLEQPRREIVNGVMWRCEGDRCTARNDGSHPLRACQRAARVFGKVAAFSAAKDALSSDQVARCNGAS